MHKSFAGRRRFAVLLISAMAGALLGGASKAQAQTLTG